MKGSLIASIGSVCIFMSAVRPSFNFVLLLTTVVAPLIQRWTYFKLDIDLFVYYYLLLNESKMYLIEERNKTFKFD